MDHVGILKRAFNITRRYRVLWIFGVLLALFGSGGGGNGGANGTRFTLPGAGEGSFPGTLPPGITLPSMESGPIIGIVIACCCLLLLVVAASVVISYVARTSLYRMVNQIEDTGVSPSWREGLRLGWSRRAARLFGIDLAVGVPFAIAVILLVAIALLPLLLMTLETDATTALGIVLAIGLLLLVIVVLIVAGVLVNLAKRFMHRQAALEDRSIGQSIVYGYQIVRTNLRDSAVMWLLMFGVGLGWGIVMIPVFIVVLLLAALVGGLPAWAIWQATEALWPTLLVGIPLFLLIMVPVLTFLNGLYLVFQSSSWTLTYREFRARELVLDAPPPPEPLDEEEMETILEIE
ncbi:MAG TPA: hypothetical protein VM537_08585 [Anaerolineae bacterium]|jgi:hypothetical protein|nr:hypothetical protein [Anaerolineae bacterium]